MSEEWRDDARCAEIGFEWFFPEKGESWQSKRAKEMCAACEVRIECLQYALDNDVRFGIWGGLSDSQRRRLERGTA